VDPGRIYLEVKPRTAPAQLVGTSVKLTISVKTTGKPVLVVPLTALSVGADGSARIQVERAGRSEYVTVNPGLAAKGLVEVEAAGSHLGPGDLVVVGEHGSSTAYPSAPGSSTAGSAPAGAGSAPSAGTGASGVSTQPGQGTTKPENSQGTTPKQSPPPGRGTTGAGSGTTSGQKPSGTTP
jgi:hypothetical protein